MRKSLMMSIMSSATRAIQRAWEAQGSGRPLTAMYLSPTVSTWDKINDETLKGVIYLFANNLVNVGIFARVSEGVEEGVDFVEHIDDMHRTLGVRVRSAVGAEADDAGEEESHAVVSARRNGPVVPQLICHRDRQHRV